MSFATPDELADALMKLVESNVAAAAGNIDPEHRELVALALYARIEQRLGVAHRRYGYTLHHDGEYTLRDLAYAAGLRTEESARTRYDPDSRRAGVGGRRGRPQRAEGDPAPRRSTLKERPEWAAPIETLHPNTTARRNRGNTAE